MSDADVPSNILRDSQEDAEAVLRFGENMLFKLSLNAKKGHWRDLPARWLLERARQELDELEQELAKSDIDPEAVVYECADAANFVMMISDNMMAGFGVNVLGMKFMRAFAPSSGGLSTEWKLQRAERALLRAGFQDLGGEEWKPPLGPVPDFTQADRWAARVKLLEARLERITGIAQGREP